MRTKFIIFVLLIFSVSVPIDLSSKIRAGKRPRMTSKSKTSVKSKNSKIVNNSTNLNAGQLQIQVNENAALEGLTVAFAQGGYSSNYGSQTSFTGTYNPTSGTVSVDNSSCQALPGDMNYPLSVVGNAALEGIGNCGSGISLATVMGPINPTVLTVNVSNAVNSDIDLNGGTILLKSDLNFGGDKQLLGEGDIEGNGNSVILGGKDLIVTSTLNWISADLVVNSRITLWGSWNFYGDTHVMGRGNVLDLSNGGKVNVGHNSRLYVANLNIRGLGSGSVLFTDDTGEIVLSSCTVELDEDYTFTKGGIYIDSTSTLIAKDKHLTFDENASMTVDGVTLWYDTTVFDDDQNIRPTVSEDPNEKFIAYFNNGVIRRQVSDPGSGGDIHYTSDVSLSGLRIYSPAMRAFFDASLIFDGNQNTVYFASNYEPVAFIADGETVYFTNVELESLSTYMFDLGVDSGMIFGDSTTIDLDLSCDLNITWTFRGQCILKGNGQTLTLGEGGAIVVQGAGSSLFLDNIKIAGVAGNNIRCTDDTTTISFSNVVLDMDNDYSFTKGRFDVVSRFDLKGDAIFGYATSQESTILSKATMFIDMGTTFNYAPSIANRDLIFMEDASSMLYLNGATLASTTTGLRLTYGTVIVDKVNYIDNPEAVSLSEGVEFGNGTPEGELNVNIVPGGKINVLSGIFNMNVSPSVA